MAVAGARRRGTASPVGRGGRLGRMAFRRRRAASDPDVTALAAAAEAAAGATAALTGAGVSVPSGIPSFRDAGGLWERFDPMEYATVDALRADPEKVWAFFWELDALVADAAPNDAHTALARMEHHGLLRGLVTQNPDGLHHAAGSRTVVELHGTGRTLSCLACGAGVGRAEVAAPRGQVPLCDRCGGVLRPDVTLFGEELPPAAVARAWSLAADCELLLVVGTSAEVEPAAAIPRVARDHGAQVWEVNPEPSRDLRADGRVGLPAEQALPALLRAMGRR